MNLKTKHIDKYIWKILVLCSGSDKGIKTCVMKTAHRSRIFGMLIWSKQTQMRIKWTIWACSSKMATKYQGWTQLGCKYK